MNINFDQLEARLQALFENQILSILPGVSREERLIQKLALALRQNIVEQKEEGAFAPNTFTLIVAKGAEQRWKEPRVMNALKNVISAAVKEVGLKMESQPIITITTDETYSEKDVSIIASHTLEPVEDTKGMAMESEKSSGNAEPFPENAFLIVEGVKVFPLKEPVINVGRRLENHLVIDDPRISRNHAQLRAINGRYVIFDLNSTGGTFVNGQRTSQTVLYPGDVISLAGVALIFGQDTPPPRLDLNDTLPLKDADSSERPTAALDQDTVDIRTGSLKDTKSHK
ncbi:MAG: FHA domain-containing protein [Chloroflexota bacterium]|nr:FHA domain-containing protein [Chloroflexota bacterium]MBI5703447.1 FHA domain-containing protein [Chloroflexota bacterium]